MSFQMCCIFLLSEMAGGWRHLFSNVRGDNSEVAVQGLYGSEGSVQLQSHSSCRDSSVNDGRTAVLF